MLRHAQVRRLGKVLYSAGLRMQAALAEYVRQGDGGRPDQVLVLEHNPVFTLGRNATRADIHASDAFLSENSFEVHRIDRGGQATYHGPGQVVAYPICDLRGGGRSVSWFVGGLEQAMIDTAGDFGVRAERLEGHPGVWVGTERGWEKLGAIGVHLKKWVSTHGLAFNVAPDMGHFGWITPCGIKDKGVCSLRTILGGACPTWQEAASGLERHLLSALGHEPVAAPAPSKSVSVTVWRRGAGGPEILMMLRCPEEGRWWSSVTGMAEPGESPEETAAREVKEETGLDGKPVPLDFSHSFWIDPTLCPGERVRDGGPMFNTEACYAMEAGRDAPVALNAAEHSECRWCPPDEAMSLMGWEGGKEGLRRTLRLAGA